MVLEEANMLAVAVELLWRQHHGEDRYFGLELNLHQTVQDGAGDEFVPIDAAIDDETGGDDGSELARLGQQFRLQRDLVTAGDSVGFDPRPVAALGFESVEEGLAPLIDDLLVPVRLDEGDAAGSDAGGQRGDDLTTLLANSEVLEHIPGSAGGQRDDDLTTFSANSTVLEHIPVTI